MTSNRLFSSANFFKADKASHLSKVAFVALRVVRLFAMILWAKGAWSTKTAHLAPRDKPSIPNAPLPAKRSKTSPLGRSFWRAFIMASRTRFLVGTVPSIGVSMILERYFPPLRRCRLCYRKRLKDVGLKLASPHRVSSGPLCLMETSRHNGFSPLRIPLPFALKQRIRL